ncbi:hypothetical protein OQA88_2129 [Cercophora sp. LCS_1]
MSSAGDKERTQAPDNSPPAAGWFWEALADHVGSAPNQQQTATDNCGSLESEVADLKRQLALKDEELATQRASNKSQLLQQRRIYQTRHRSLTTRMDRLKSEIATLREALNQSNQQTQLAKDEAASERQKSAWMGKGLSLAHKEVMALREQQASSAATHQDPKTDNARTKFTSADFNRLAKRTQEMYEAMENGASGRLYRSQMEEREKLKSDNARLTAQLAAANAALEKAKKKMNGVKSILKELEALLEED